MIYDILKQMKKILLLLSFFLGLGLIIKFVPLSIEPSASITVNGEARQASLPQIAYFTASVTVTDKDKQAAVNQVNQAMAGLLQSLKEFGMEAKDIQTQNVAAYEDERRGNWQVSNSVRMTLRQMDKVSALADLLAQDQRAEVSGPSYGLEDTTEMQTELLAAAVADAREKAQKIAQSSGRKLGKVLTVTESGASYPRPMAIAEKADSSTPVEPGTETVFQSVTVTFALK